MLEEGNTYKDLFTIMHYIISRVKGRHFRDEESNPIENRFGYFKNAKISNINMLNIDIDDLSGEDKYDWLNDNFENTI